MIIIFDTETTGLTLPSAVSADRQPRLIEFGAIKLGKGGRIISELSQLIYPEELISETITKITGVTNEELKDAPKFRDFLPTLRRFFGKTKWLIAHNAPFDVSILKYELVRSACDDFPWPEDVIDTAQEYAPIIGYNPFLKTIYSHVLGKELAQTHRAIDDVRALHEALVHDDFYHKVGCW